MREKVVLHGVASAVLSRIFPPAPRRTVSRSADPVVRFLVLNFKLGGITRSVLALAEALSEHRRVEIVSLSLTEETAFHSAPQGLPCRVLDDQRSSPPGRLRRLLSRVPTVLMHPDDASYRYCSLWTDLQLLRWLRSTKDGVLVGSRPALNLVIARFTGGSLVTVGQEHMHPAVAYTPELRADIQRFYGRLDAVATLTARSEADYATALSGTDTHVFRIPNPVPPITVTRPLERERTVVSIGRLVHEKGYDLLIPTFAAVAKTHPDWRLRIYGEGVERSALERLTVELGLEDVVELAGATNDVGEALARSAICVMSSRYEGFPVALIEAMSMGVPVVSFDCPTGPSEVIVHGENGILVPAGDTARLAAGISELIDDPLLRKRLGDAGLRTARLYEVERIAASWDAELRGLVASRAERTFAPPVSASADDARAHQSFE